MGIGESFGNAFIWLMWIYVLAPWMADPGAVMLSQFMGWDWLYNSAEETFLGGLSYEWGSFVIASIASVIAFSLVAFGLKIFAKAQKVAVMVLGLLGTGVIVVVLFMYSKQDFINAWNTMAGEYGSLNYNDFITAAGDAAGGAMPTTWNWSDTLGVMVAGSWLFAYSYCITFIAGEVKRPTRRSSGRTSSPSWFRRCSWSSWPSASTGWWTSTSCRPRPGWTTPERTRSAGCTMAASPHFVGLAAVVMHNKVLCS